MVNLNTPVTLIALRCWRNANNAIYLTGYQDILFFDNLIAATLQSLKQPWAIFYHPAEKKEVHHGCICKNPRRKDR